MKDKKILMFGPSFFGYTECIADQLRSLGAQVDLYDERPNNGVVCKTMLRYNVRLYYPKVAAYYKSVAEANRDKDYDFIFVIKSEAIDKAILQMLRVHFPKAQCILYLWDAVANVPGGKEKLGIYDRVLTFDHVDAEDYKIPLRPLFFRKDYAASSTAKTDFAYDVAFIGTAHSIRPRVVQALDAICQKEGRKCFKFLFLPHIFVFFYNKLLNSAYRNVRKSDICFTPMKPEQIRAVYDDSRCILDVEHVAQRGLTMRTIEMIGMGKKLITTNTGIQKYDFYNPANICVIDRDNPAVPADFWDKQYTPIPQNIIDRYSLESFVREIFVG